MKLFQKRISLTDLIWVFIILEVILHFLLPIKQIIYFPYRYIGILLIILDQIPNFWYGIYFRKIKTSLGTYDKPKKLVTSGLFRISRNPIYLGMVLTLLGVAILLGSISPFITA